MDWGFMNSMPYQKVLRGLEPEHHHHATSSHLYEASKSQDYEGIQATYLSQKQKRDLPMCGWDPIRSQDNINSKSSRDIAYRQAPVLAQRPPAGFNSPSLGIFAWQRLYHHFFTPLSRCFVYLKPPSTVAARLSLCVTFFFFSTEKRRLEEFSFAFVDSFDCPPTTTLPRRHPQGVRCLSCRLHRISSPRMFSRYVVLVRLGYCWGGDL